MRERINRYIQDCDAGNRVAMLLETLDQDLETRLGEMSPADLLQLTGDGTTDEDSLV